MVQNSPEWSKWSKLVQTVQGGPEWSKKAQSVKMVQNYLTWSKPVQITICISNPEISERYFFMGHPVVYLLLTTLVTVAWV